MKSKEELDRIENTIKKVILENKSSFTPIEKESDLIYLIKKLLEKGLNIEYSSPERAYETDETTFHLLSVKTEEFLDNENNAVLFAELYDALDGIKEAGLIISSKIISRNNELYISYYGEMTQYKYFKNLLRYWNDIVFILERQSHWSAKELYELEEKLRSEITGENDVIYSKNNIV